jgi:hypothetical protein
MVAEKKLCIRCNTITSLVANLSTERLGRRGIICYWTNPLEKHSTYYIIPSFIIKTTKLHGIRCHHLWEC